MSSKDQIRNAIISEIEENIQFMSNSRSTYLQDGNQIEKEGVLSPETLQLAMMNGVDSRLVLEYRKRKEMYENYFDYLDSSSTVDFQNSTDVLDAQLTSYYTSMKKIEFPGGKSSVDEECSIRERLTSAVAIPAAILEPGFTLVRPMRSALKEAVSEYSLVSGVDKKKDRKDKKKPTKASPSFKSRHETTPTLVTRPPTEQDYLMLLLVKSIAENSLSSLVMVITVLLGVECSGNDQEMLPVGSIISAIFAHSSESSGSHLEKVINPFYPFLSGFHDQCASAGDCSSKKVAVPCANSYGGGSSSSSSSSGLSVDYRESPAVVDPAEADEDDLDEEELLAQALALSMGIDVGAEAENPSTAAVDIIKEVSSFGESGCNEIHDSVGSGVNDELLGHMNGHFYPDVLSGVRPFCTVGPLCQPDFWSSLRLNDPSVASQNTMSIRNILVALLVRLGVTADKYLNEDSCKFDDFSHCSEDQAEEVCLEFSYLSKTAPSLIVATPLNFMLIEHTIRALLAQVGNVQSSLTFCSSSHSPILNGRYLCIWALQVCIKVLRALLLTAVNSGEKMSVMGLESTVPLGQVNRNTSKPSLPVALSLFLTLSDCINPVVLKFALDELQAMGDKTGHYQQIHDFRLLAMSTFLTGLPVFVSQALDRDRLLLAVLQIPCAVDVLMPLVSLDLSTEFAAGPTYVLPDDYYLFIFVQYLCVCPSILAHPLRYHCYRQNLSILDSDGVVDTILSLLYLPSMHLIPSSTRKSIECELFHRFKMFSGSSQLEVDYHPDSLPEYIVRNDSFQQWGELILFRSIQMMYENMFLHLNAQLLDPAQGQSTISFYPFSTSSNLTLSSGNATATYAKVSSGWGTAVADSMPFPVNSGNHEWKVYVNRSDKGDLFLGVVSAQASLSTYIGGDCAGWGMFGTKSTWHRREKVGANYPFAFKSHDTIYFRLDTDNRTLHARKGNSSDWLLVFSDLPPVTLFAAISLRNSNDAVTIQSESVNNAVSPASPIIRNSSCLSADKFCCLKQFIAHVQHCCAEADFLLLQAFDQVNQIVNESEKLSKIQHLFGHPLIGLCLPSLAACLANASLCQKISGIIAIELLPAFSSCTRRVSEILSVVTSLLPADDNETVVRSSFTGEWLIKSAQVGNSLPAQEYALGIDAEEPLHDKGCLGITAFKGVGESPLSSVFVQGYINGTKLLFQEEWVLGGICTVEARLSLCGCYFSGTFTDEKLKKSGSVEGFRQSIRLQGPDEMLRSSFETLRLVAIVVTSAIGKLAGLLIEGLPCTTVNASNLNRSANVTPTLESESDHGSSVEDPVLDSSKSGDDVKSWANSELFSSGLPIRMLKARIYEELRFYSQQFSENFPDSKSIGEAVYGANSHAGVAKYWYQRVFSSAIFRMSEESSGNNLLDDLDSGVPTDSSEVESFINSLTLGSEATIRLDDWMQQHTSPFFLGKIGGAALIAARRFVLAALIRHTGCGDFCLKLLGELVTASLIASGNDMTKDSGCSIKLDSRPMTALKELWFGAQRIIQDVMRIRQTTGVSITSTCQFLREKAEFLLHIEPSGVSKELADVFALENPSKSLLRQSVSDEIESDPSSRDSSSDSSIPNFTKLLAECIRFLLCPTRNIVSLLGNQFAESAFLAVTRIAGFNSLLLLLQPFDDVPDVNFPRAGINAIAIQPYAFHHVLPSLLRRNYQPLDLVQEGAPSSEKSQYKLDNLLMNGHYTAGVSGISLALRNQLASSFESVFSFIAQLLSRCSWAGYKEGQLLCLSCWNIRISIKDHMFLNRVGIFKILQRILDESRAVVTESKAISGSCTLFEEDSSGHWNVTANNLVRNLYSSIAQSSLRIVHSLASQVANSQDSRSRPTTSLQLQRLPSGPDTLSQSLFDLLYAELYYCLKDMISSFQWSWKDESAGEVATSSETAVKGKLSEAAAITFLRGEDYIYRILRLLYSVSNSTVCQKSLSSSKWLSLLMMGITCGGLSIQRRIFRLLRRLLSTLNPDSVRLFVSYARDQRVEICCSSGPLEDFEINGLIDQQLSMAGTEHIGHMSISERFVCAMFEYISLVFSASWCGEDDAIHKLIGYLNTENTLFAVTSEAIALIRALQGFANWRVVIDRVVMKIFQSRSRGHDSNKDYLALYLAAVSVNGGFVERCRIGGCVNLTPFGLASKGDLLSHQLTGFSRGHGLIVDSHQHSGELEMVFLERMAKTTLNQTENSSDKQLLNFQHICSVTATVPVVAIKVKNSRLVPTGEFPTQANFVSPPAFKAFLTRVLDITVPIMKKFVREGSEAPKLSVFNARDDQAEFNIVDILVEILSLKSLAEFMQHRTYVEHFLGIQFDPTVSITSSFHDLISISAMDSMVGGLGDIEVIENRWQLLWDSLVLQPTATGRSQRTSGVSQLFHTSSSSPPPEFQIGGAGKVLAHLRRQMDRASTREHPVPADGARSFGSSSRHAAELDILGQINSSAARRVNVSSRQLVDPPTMAAQVAQMQEMGLQKEWCEVALRRCRFNIEMAINMCFEHGSDMAMMVQEEAFAREAAAARASNETQVTSGRGDDRDLRGEGADLGLFGRLMPGMLGSRRPGRQASSSGIPQVLLDLGIPPHVCLRAMHESGNDVQQAIGWLLAHGETGEADSSFDILASRLGSLGHETSTASARQSPASSLPTSTVVSTVPSSAPSVSDTSTILNPLVLVSGTCDIESNLTCSSTVEFPSVGARGFAAARGKWYFEVTLHSAGCIQIGWADSAFKGNSNHGQGVGDDAHSWAFDGWRVCLWHETAADWGCKWSIGDILGCAADLDNGSISFYLNGYGLAVEMGIAFSDINYLGGLYPCASFSRGESIQFNFGSTPFQHALPEGYKPFLDHINWKVAEFNSQFEHHNISSLSLCNLGFWPFSRPTSNSLENNEAISLNRTGNSGDDNELLIDDAIEECHECRELDWRKRYFAADESKGLKGSKLSQQNHNEHKLQSDPLPSSPEKLLLEFAAISRDLMVLYSRMIQLRIFNSLPNISSSQVRVISSNLCNAAVVRSTQPSTDVNDFTQDKLQSNFELLVVIIRATSLTTSRTHAFRSIIGTLPKSLPVPYNLGHLLSTGGAPFLYHLSDSMKLLLANCKQLDAESGTTVRTEYLINLLLDHVRLETVNSGRRTFASGWRLHDGFVPTLGELGNNAGKISDCFAEPSLSFAVWLTNIIIDVIAGEVNLVTDGDLISRVIEPSFWSRVSFVMERLCLSWIQSLKSPNILVKTCACKMLSTFLQEFTMSSAGSRFSHAPSHILPSLAKHIPISRLSQLALSRLCVERGALPVVSEYLQAILELLFSASQVHSASPSVPGSPSGKLGAPVESGEVPGKAFGGTANIENIWGEIDEANPSFNWEAISGRLMSGEGWVTWTGQVTQLGIEGTPRTSSDKRPDRQHEPPELMPGCKVSMPYSGTPRSDIVAAIESLDIDDDSRDSTKFHPQMRRTTSGSLNSEKSAVKSDRIGTVIRICDWNESDSLRGTARLIRWDDDGSEQIVRWGADGNKYDVSHLKVKDGNIVGKYPPPMHRDQMFYRTGFGQDAKFGVIVRLREVDIPITSSTASSDGEEKPVKRLLGVMEWPDFNAVVRISGERWEDGRWVITEKALLSGVNHAPWGIRFGHSHWRPGTSFELLPSRDPMNDASDRHSGTMVGSFSYCTAAPAGKVIVVGDICIQRSKLFVFDEDAKGPKSTIAADKCTFAKSNENGQTCVFGTVGFSSGVHYWEFKIEQAEVGSIFLGVAEKPFPPGTPASAYLSRCGKWLGIGFCNNRLSLRSASQTAPDRLACYGDHFISGDVVGVLLDMNRGRLSFFLDGLKYGEHSLTDLGEAFDQLATPYNARPRTLYPVVGLQKSLDRVTITPRWLSTISIPVADDVGLIGKAWRQLTCWSLDRPTSKPFAEDLWTYRTGWRDWLKLKAGRYVRVKTRCKTLGILLELDTNPIACVEASIRLGLTKALFRGDRISFFRSSGRPLDIREEAIILGAHNGQLWYRLENQQGDVASVESGAPAWSLAPSDVDGFVFVRRGYVGKGGLPEEVADLLLPVLPAFAGGLLFLSHAGGAVMRNGIEIDHSDVLCTTPPNITVYAVERRVNASNIARFRVLYDGKYGWISERMRGGAEEVMLSRVTSATMEEVDMARQQAVDSAASLGITDPIIRTNVASLREALGYWENLMRAKGFEDLLEDWKRSEFHPDILQDSNPQSFKSYMDLASTMDGLKNWSVEADMQLVELMSKSAHRLGVSPQNLPVASIARALEEVDSETSLLHGLNIERGIARAALVRVANQVFAHTLPFLSLGVPEEKLRSDIYGNDSVIDIAPSSSVAYLDPKRVPPMDITVQGNVRVELQENVQARKGEDTNDNVHESRSHVIPCSFSSMECKWTPPCGAKRLRSLRRLLFFQTKNQHWESILDATSTPTALQQDEYEDPREIKTLKINRVKATSSRLVSLPSAQERISQSVFGQLFKELRQWPSSAFRRAYLSKGHGGQKRAFKVKFMGEGVNDYGGPYRAVFEQVVDELQTYASVSAGKKLSEMCLLPLLVPCANRMAAVGTNQDKFVLSTAPVSAMQQEYMNFFGKLLGTAVRHNLSLALDLSSFVWRPLVSLPLSLPHLESIDSLATKNFEAIAKKGLELEQQAADNPGMQIPVPDEWADLTLSVMLPDGSRLPLVPSGESIPVNLSNWRYYLKLAERCRLCESSVLYRALREGISEVLPMELLPLFTPQELEQLVTGSSKVDLNLLRQCTEYENVSPDSDHVRYFWEVIEEMSDEERTLFLRFVWARSRMPASLESLPMNFKIQAPQGQAKDSPNDYLPHAQTCFFSLSLPAYTSKEILRTKLLYAINNSPNMDADVRLHNADGWADS